MFKLRKREESEVNLVTDPAQLEIDNDKLSTTDTSDTEGESGTWFCVAQVLF